MDQAPQAPAILIVDDDPATLVLLAHYARKLAPGHDILTAENAHSALDQLAHRNVPLLITDYLLPDMSGLHLIAAVKAASPTTYVVLTSADNSAALTWQAQAQQVDTFLSKLDLLARLGEVLQGALAGAH
jgi:two-component system cell cycle response regulator